MLKQVVATIREPKHREHLCLSPEGIVLARLSGTEIAELYAVEGQTIVAGRSPLCNVTLDDPSVSQFHLSLTVHPEYVTIEDTNSSNGLWVGRARVRRADLLPGARFRAGNVRLQLRTIEASRFAITEGTEFYGARGNSPRTRRMFSLLARVSPTPLPILITGETGTGKGVVARAIHAASGRTGPLVTVDCTTLPHALAESELFGHTKGAFTGATSTRRSRFEEAHKGTIFLDEIGELPAGLQPKLLRVLDEKVVRRVGDTQERSVDTRIIAATNRHLPAEIHEGRFRADLYHRLAGVPLRLPALRDRPEDITFLARVFLDAVSKKVGRTLEFSPSALANLERRPWEGNVRQLLQTVERAAFLCEDDIVDANDVAELGDGSIPEGVELPDTLEGAAEAAKRAYLLELLPQCATVDEAAKRAQVTPRGLRMAAKRLGLSAQDLLNPGKNGG